MLQIYWLQLLKCEKLPLIFVAYDSKLNIFGFWTPGQTKQAVLTLVTVVMVILNYFLTI